MSYQAPLLLFASHSILFTAHSIQKNGNAFTGAITDPLTITFVLFLISWFRASNAQPVPISKFPKHNDPIVQQYMSRKKNYHMRYCKMCDVYKPDRTHHCHILKTCVLVMDHYDPYLLNCVGHHNIKTFLLFRFYSIVHALGTCTSSVQALINVQSYFSFNTVTVVSAIVFSFAVCSFHVYVFWVGNSCVFRGYTIIEWYERGPGRGRGACKRRSDLWKDGSLYDRGALGNIQYFLGKWPWLWLLPIGNSANGNGILPEPNAKGKILLLQAKQVAIEKLKSKKE